MVHSHRPPSLASGAIASSHGGQSAGLPSFKVASEPVRENGACPMIWILHQSAPCRYLT